MAKYRVDTDKGSYMVETEDAPSVPGMEKLGGAPPSGPRVALPTELSRTSAPGSLSRKPTNQEALGAPTRGAGYDRTQTRGGGASDEYRDPSFEIPGISGQAQAIADVPTVTANIGRAPTADESKRGQTRGNLAAGNIARAANGVMAAGTAMLPGAIAAAPARTLVGVGTGALTKAGVDAVPVAKGYEGYRDLAGDALALGTGMAASNFPGSRLSSATQAGAKAAIKATPMIGKGVRAFAEDLAKTSPDYVDPKAVRQAELAAQTVERAKARVRATAEAKAKLKADAEVKAKADSDAKVAADKSKAARIGARVDATQGSTIPPTSTGPIPDVEPIPGSLPSGRVPGTGEPNLPPLPEPPVPRVPLWQSLDVQATPSEPPAMAPPPSTRPTLPSGRVPGNGTGEPPAMPPPAPPRASLYQKAMEGRTPEPIPEVAPPVATEPPRLRSGRIPGTGEPKVSAPPIVQPAATVAPAPATQTPTGPSAPEGSLVVPPVEGRPSRYSNIGGKLGQQVADAAHAKDTAVAKHLASKGVTEEQFRAADDAQRAKWAREVNPKYKGYTDPERIDDLVRMLKGANPSSNGGTVAKSLSDAILDQQEQQ